MPRLLLLVLAVLVLPLAHAQAPPLIAGYSAPETTGYDASIPTPEAVLGYAIGERHSTPYDVERYVAAVADASDRVTVAEHARSYEGRALIHAIVTSPANHARLEAIRVQNLRLSDAPQDVSDADLDTMPASIYLGYSVHGNEASGTEAALLTLYHLAAGEGPAVDRLLENAVVLIDPMLNPDGRDRFADWANRWRSAAAPTADPQNIEHNEAWPGGRTNHYFFDLNRDWLPGQLPESRGRLALFHHWRPQYLADFHEMGSESTFFFQPGIASRTNPNTPQTNRDLTARLAEYHARFLDDAGQLYYSGESFDDFYYGKGSTYPDVNGAVGVLFEQASSRALRRETRSGELDYATSVRNQLSASLSSLAGVVAMRTDFLRMQRDFYREAPDVARASATKAYIVATDRYPHRAAELAETLRRHRIRVHALVRTVEQGGRRYEPGAAFIVPVDQPQARLILAAMERVTTFEDSLFYDVSAWTLPLAFGLDSAELASTSGLLGDEWSAPDSGQRIGGRAGVAYLIPWGRYFAPRTLYRLQEAGVVVRLATEPFELPSGGVRHSFERGTLIVPVTQSGVDAETVHDLIQTAVDQDGLEVFAVGTGLTPDGIDLGSPSARVLTRPDVAVLAGSGTSSYRVGEAWHLLSERMHVPVSLIDADRLPSLDRYTTLIIAGGVRVDDEATEAITSWVRGGGTLVTTAEGASWVSRHDLLAMNPFEADADSSEIPYADRSATRGAQAIGGTIAELALDTTHPLAYGVPARLPVFKTNTLFFEGLPPDGYDVGRYTERLSGYLSAENAERLPGKAALMAGRMGRGRVVVMDFEPTFRAFWYGSDALLLNAVFFGGAF